MAALLKEPTEECHISPEMWQMEFGKTPSCRKSSDLRQEKTVKSSDTFSSSQSERFLTTSRSRRKVQAGLPVSDEPFGFRRNLMVSSLPHGLMNRSESSEFSDCGAHQQKYIKKYITEVSYNSI